MLKSLELHGFKSFADKTRFEFASGITVVVGPNGSGKSNVVDAIKWALGEQSIKSLRGKESTDVIFNGASDRRAQNTAEVTLHFDNADHSLPYDARDVYITRRVYRGGEGEYLINKQPSRLKDIRELLSGSGVGANSYSIIEQGRVDALLQSSPKDRRLIFEEAAGISRFKAKKQEAFRRLEHVEQNLLRLSDIVAEVEGQLRNIKSQADRAVRFREYNARLQELRMQVAAVDWKTLTDELTTLNEELETLRAQRDGMSENVDAVDTRLLEYENDIAACDQRIRQYTDLIADNRHAIGVAESAVEYQLKRSRELEQSIALDRTRTATIRKKISESMQLHHDAEADLGHARTQHREVVAHLKEVQVHLEEVQRKLDEIRAGKEVAQRRSVEWMREHAATENQITQLVRQQDTLSKQVQENEARLASLDEELAGLRQQEETLLEQQRQTKALKRRCTEEQDEARQELDSDATQLSEARANLAELTHRHSAMVERISVLEELQERHEGLSPGVRYLLTESRQQPHGPFRDLRGLVADLIQVNVDAAALVEVALGERAQYLVVNPGSVLLAELKQNAQGFPGRVGFVWMDEFLPADGVPRENSRLARTRLTTALDGLPGVLGRADQFIQAEEENLPLMRYLLGETWIVENLATAVELSEKIASGELKLLTFSAAERGFSEDTPVSAVLDMRHYVPPRVHFVTLSGERLDADGTLCVGPQHAASGLISRRSELRTLGEQLSIQQIGIKNAEADVQSWRLKTQRQKARVEELATELEQVESQLREHGNQLSVARERLAQVRNRHDEMTRRQEEYHAQLSAVGESLEDTRNCKNTLEQQTAECEKSILRMDEEIASQEEIRRKKNGLVTENQVALAKSEERLEGLEARVKQCEATVQERRKSIEDGVAQLEANCGLLVESQRTTLLNESRLASLYLEKEQASRALEATRQKRETARRERSELNQSAGRLRKKMRTVEDKIHQLELSTGAKELQRRTLVEKLEEELHIDVAAWMAKATQSETNHEEVEDYETVQREIQDLRNRIQKLGNINADAVLELEDLEKRYAKLAGAYEDLTEAKETLAKIIEKTNHDSRQLFLKTFEDVGGHFYDIFRDLFGGGHAELVLDEGVDVLESGVEIVVQPPGKELRTLSLMSGGEKTMTCVAMLLALFKYRPSPFCVLDEVDAALDEANIDRLMEVVKQFLDRTQFIVISHSKKTIAHAHSIYGVTMQDSGISKQVSVRFEDVREDGEIEALGIKLFPDERTAG